VADQAKAGEEWREFFRVKALSLGVYSLKKGASDTQSPHKQDEIYYVVSGRATLTVEGKAHPVQPGSTLYVAARAKHRFHDITEDLTTLVFFAPAYEE
jgi:mannose-6-phosphate isomerase-like protein (cupin superfamily)